MNILLWILQIAFAVLFVTAGGAKAFTSITDLAAQIPWTADVPVWVVRLAGFSEVLGAIGLILPGLTRIRPQLTSLAAGGLALVMVLAAIFHLTRGDFFALPVNVGLFLIAAFVAHGRWKLAPIAPR